MARRAFSSLEIYHPVQGASVAPFLQSVEHIGKLLGNSSLGYVAELVPEVNIGDVTEPYQATGMLTSIGEPRLEVFPANSLRLRLLEREAPATLRLGGAFRRVIGRMMTNVDKTPKQKNEPRMQKIEGLQSALNNILYSCDSEDVTPERIQVEFDAYTLKGQAEHDSELGFVLALVPSIGGVSTIAVMREAIRCSHSSARHSNKVTYPSRDFSLDVPFARLPVDVSDEERRVFGEKIRGLLPIKLSFSGQIDHENHR